MVASTVMNPPIAVKARADHDADDFRSAIGGGFLGVGGATDLIRSGILPGHGAEFTVTQRASPGMGVLVGAGACVLAAPTAGHGGWVLVNASVVDVPITAAHATLARTDLIIARVADVQYYAGGDGNADVKVVTGTAGGGVPTVPVADGSYIVLAQVAVAAATAAILNANITLNTNASRPYTVSVGGILPVGTAALRTALVAHDGMHVHQIDTDALWVWNAAAAAWEMQGGQGLVVAPAIATANQAGITTEVDLTGMTLTFTPAPNRYYRLRGHLGFVTSVSGGLVRANIKEGATGLQQKSMSTGSTSAELLDIEAILVAPSASSHTYKLTALLAIGGGTMTLSASASAPSYFTAEDLGPV